MFLPFSVLLLLTAHTCMGDSESVYINYQKLKYAGESINITVQYSGKCNRILAEAFTREAIISNEAEPLRHFEAVRNGAEVTIPVDKFSKDNKMMFMRVIARDQSDNLICSDKNSQETFYRFNPDGMYNT